MEHLRLYVFISYGKWRACQKSIQDFHTSSFYIKLPSWSFAIHLGIFFKLGQIRADIRLVMPIIRVRRASWSICSLPGQVSPWFLYVERHSKQGKVHLDLIQSAMTKMPVLLVELYLPEDRLRLYRVSAPVPSGTVSQPSSALSAPSFQLLLPFLDVISFISSMILWSVDFTIKSTSKTLQKSCC